jgi:large subunit ribosomal protein L4
MKTKVYNLSGKVTGEVELSSKVFGVKIKPEVVHSVFVAQTNNQRAAWADTKDRGEVSGGGKKPWAQKGTGRARHGSIRSPIWKGGGVAFGPLTICNYATKINKKTKRLVIKMCFSDKAANNNLIVVENFAFFQPKTKLFSEFLNVLPEKRKSFLVLTTGKDDSLVRMTKNIKKVNTMRAEDANVMALLRNEAIIISEEALKKLETVFK